jgi:hypothetical protein
MPRRSEPAAPRRVHVPAETPAAATGQSSHLQPAARRRPPSTARRAHRARAAVGQNGVVRDWVDWHQAYADPASGLSARLRIVQRHLARAIGGALPGPVRLVSLCAGQGHDVIGVLRGHPLRHHVTAVLVEADPRNAALARSRAAAAGLDQVQVRQADASRPATFADALPADVLLLCGIFGNVSDEDIRRTVGFLPALCAPRGWVIWTRQPREDGILPVIQGWFEGAGFRPQALVVAEGNLFGVGAARLTTPPRPFRSGQELFTFVR